MSLKLFSILVLFILVSCSHSEERPRKTNVCIFSRYYGGPYRVISSEGERLALYKIKTNEIKELPKDNSWLGIPCGRQ